jgi:CheY-like chemotaxis protein
VVRLPILEESRRTPPGVLLTTRAPKLHRIVVVDDNRDAADALSMLLELSGCETHVAYDGIGAIDAVNRYRPDAVLLDIGLPTMSGLEVCRQIRSEPWGKDVVLVALTGWGQEDDRRQSKEAGFDGHLVKPVDQSELEELLRKIAVSREGQVATNRPVGRSGNLIAE